MNCNNNIKNIVINVDKVVEHFNMSFNGAEIPKSWKVAKVTPLAKAGNSIDVNSTMLYNKNLLKACPALFH